MYMRNGFLSVVVGFVIGVCSCTAQGIDKLDAFINKEGDSLYQAAGLPGLFIGVLDNGRRTYYNFGFADQEKKIPFDSATLFEAGSITKTFTAFILSSVLKEKGINETESIFRFLPDSVQVNKSLRQITFLNLLNHTSGLPRLPANMDLQSRQPYETYDANSLFSFLRGVIPSKVGTFGYSNLGFGLAAGMAGIISKKTFAQLLDEYVFLPFQLLKPGESIEATDKKSQGYFNGEAIDYWKFDALAGAGALKCTAAEMLTYLRCMAMPDAKIKPIADKVTEVSFTVSPDRKIGRAWIIEERKNQATIYWHNGGTYGFSTYSAFVKGQQKAVIVVVNKFNANTISDSIGREIMELLTN